MRVAGVAAAVPRNVIHTTDFDFFTPEEAEVFNNTVGIKQRHLASDDVCASDLCFAAAEKLLADLKWERESVDVLITDAKLRPEQKSALEEAGLDVRMAPENQ